MRVAAANVIVPRHVVAQDSAAARAGGYHSPQETPQCAELGTYQLAQVEHLDGRKVRVAAAGVTVPGHVVSLAGEGMPLFEHPDRHGDLYVTVTVAFPKQLTEKQKATVRKTFEGLHDEL